MGSSLSMLPGYPAQGDKSDLQHKSDVSQYQMKVGGVSFSSISSCMSCCCLICILIGVLIYFMQIGDAEVVQSVTPIGRTI